MIGLGWREGAVFACLLVYSVSRAWILWAVPRNAQSVLNAPPVGGNCFCFQGLFLASEVNQAVEAPLFVVEFVSILT